MTIAKLTTQSCNSQGNYGTESFSMELAGMDIIIMKTPAIDEQCYVQSLQSKLLYYGAFNTNYSELTMSYFSYKGRQSNENKSYMETFWTPGAGRSMISSTRKFIEGAERSIKMY